MPRTPARFQKLAAALAFILISLPAAYAQNASGACPTTPVKDHGQPLNGQPLASPPAQAETQLDGKTLTIRYNAPSIRCRTIMGDVVPYGQPWRTGANPATSFATAADLTIGTLHVPAGSYTLYTLPAAPGTPWQLIVNKETGQWGTVYHEAQDLGRTPMQSNPRSTPQEVMSITFEKSTPTSTQLHIRWEKTDEWVEVKPAR